MTVHPPRFHAYLSEPLGAIGRRGPFPENACCSSEHSCSCTRAINPLVQEQADMSLLTAYYIDDLVHNFIMRAAQEVWTYVLTCCFFAADSS